MSDVRAPYIEIVILKLKKAISTQLELNIIMSSRESDNVSVLQSSVDELKIQPHDHKNRNIKISYEDSPKSVSKVNRAVKYSPLKNIKK